MTFAAAMIDPPQPRCVGVRLRPLSLGHVLMLQHIECEIGSSVSYSDLVAGAFVCSRRWKSNLTSLSNPLRTRVYMRAWSLLAGSFDVKIQSAVFSKYIQDSLEIPSPKKPSKGGFRELASDWNTRLYLFLRSAGFDHVEALDFPIFAANKMLVSRLEESGLVEFKTERELMLDEKMARALDGIPS